MKIPYKITIKYFEIKKQGGFFSLHKDCSLTFHKSFIELIKQIFKNRKV